MTPGQLVVAVVAAAVASLASAPAAGAWSFSTPSGNIGCEVHSERGTRVVCSALSSARGHDNLDTTYRYFAVRKRGRTRSWRSDNYPGGGIVPIIRYGVTWSFDRHRQYVGRLPGLVQCTSKRRGLRCRNRDRHGFFISRERSRKF